MDMLRLPWKEPTALAPVRRSGIRPEVAQQASFPASSPGRVLNPFTSSVLPLWPNRPYLVAV